MFTVFGATGNTGAVVAERLLAAGKSVRALVRDPNKAARLSGAELVPGDLTDPAAVARALEGAEGAFLIAPPDFTAPDLLAKNRTIIDHFTAGLRAAKVPHAVFLSSVGAHLPSGTGPTMFAHHAERTLPKAEGTRLSFVRAPFFMENLVGQAAVMRERGILPVFGGGETYPFPMIASRDIGEIAARTLLSPPSATQWIELEGPRAYSYTDAAAIASEVLGRTVTATPLPLEAMVPTLMQAGFSPGVAELFRELNESIGRGLIGYEGRGRRERGRVELAEVLRAGLAAGLSELRRGERAMR